MKKVFLDELPTKFGIGANSRKQIIDWSKSIGKEIRFEYEDIVGVFKIVSYDVKKYKCEILYHNDKYSINLGQIKRCELGNILGIKSKRFRISIGEKINDNGRDLVITNREYRKCNTGENIKYYKYTCKKCGWTEGWITEGNLIGLKRNCSCCSGRVVIPNINSIYAKAKWMLKWISEEDAKNNLPNGSKKITVTCPDCGGKKLLTPNKIYQNKSIGCNCGDGTSYPEKFMVSVLKQIGIEFQTQLNKTILKWCGDKKYDFYIPSLNMIIETHGEQHYRQSNKFKRTLEEERENDKLKRELALNNGIEHYIELDCRCSDMDFVKNNISNSKLNELFDLSKIDWVKCEEYALSNLVKEVCDYWNDVSTNLEDIRIEFNKSESCIRTYLRKGNSLKWLTKTYKHNLKVGVKVYKNGVFFKEFGSMKEIEDRSYNIFGFNIHKSVLSNIKNKKIDEHYYKDLTFIFI